MVCNSCGAQNPDENLFCMKCGKQITPVVQQQGAASGLPTPTQNIVQPGYTPSAPPPQRTPQQPLYQQPYGGGYYQQPQYQTAVRTFLADKKMVAASLACFSGLMVFISTFLGWFGPLSGWTVMVHSAEIGGQGWTANFLFIAGLGKFLFTGFWSLLLGILMIVAGILLFVGFRKGAILQLIVGVLATVFVLVNIVMTVTSSTSRMPGAGLWLFAIFGILGLVAGILGIRST